MHSHQLIAIAALQEMFSHSKQAKQVSPSVLQEIYTMKLKGVETVCYWRYL